MSASKGPDMRAALQSLLLLVLAAGLLSCGGAESRGDSPTCDGGFAEETAYRYGEPEGECHLLAYFTGVVVLLPSTSVDRGWVLSGRVGEESFTCTVIPGMLGSDRCSDNPRSIGFRREFFSALTHATCRCISKSTVNTWPLAASSRSTNGTSRTAPAAAGLARLT